MSSCLECGKCPCYEHERRTAHVDYLTPPPPGPPRCPCAACTKRPSVGGPTILLVLFSFLSAAFTCAYLLLP